MDNWGKRLGVLSVIFALLAGIVGCSSGGPSNPRETVISFFGAMEKNDQAALAHLLDLPSLMRNTQEDYSVSSDSVRIFHNPQEILNDLTGDGLTKQRWFSYQRILGDADVYDDAATVEVTFVDKERSRAYLTRFGLHKVNGSWKIFSFKTTQASQEDA